MKINLEIENNIIVGYTLYPLDEETAVEIDNDTFILIGENIGQITADYEIIEDKNELLKLKIQKFKNNLMDTDYQAIKYAEGLINEEDYEPIKLQRQSWRDEINKLEGELEK